MDLQKLIRNCERCKTLWTVSWLLIRQFNDALLASDSLACFPRKDGTFHGIFGLFTSMSSLKKNLANTPFRLLILLKWEIIVPCRPPARMTCASLNARAMEGRHRNRFSEHQRPFETMDCFISKVSFAWEILRRLMRVASKASNSSSWISTVHRGREVVLVIALSWALIRRPVVHASLVIMNQSELSLLCSLRRRIHVSFGIYTQQEIPEYVPHDRI